MNSFLVLFPALIVYLGALYYLLKLFKFKQIWLGPEIDSHSSNPMVLTHIVKRSMDILLILALIIVSIIPIVVVIMAISQSLKPTWGIDIGVFSGFMIDLKHLSGVDAIGVRKREFSGKTILNIDTSSIYAWYLFIIISEMSAIIALYVLTQLRAIVMSFQLGISFTNENSHRVKKIGMVVIACNVINPLLQYYAWGSVIKEISFNTQGLLLYPTFEINIMGLLIGSMLILLSKMLQEATDIQKEQELTI
jgi:hypothetical protein